MDPTPSPGSSSPPSDGEGKRRPDPFPDLPLPVKGELVLLKPGASLTRAADSSVAPQRFEAADNERAVPFAARVVSVQAPWVEIETLPSDVAEDQCFQLNWLRRGAFALRLFVHLEDVELVNRETFEKVDGPVKWVVGAGEPLIPVGDEFGFRTDPFGIEKVPVRFNSDRVGRSYSAARSWASRPRRTNSGVDLAGLELPYDWATPSPACVVERKGEDQSTVSLREGCTTLEFEVPTAAIYESVSGRGVRYPPPITPKWTAPAQTEVFWPDGSLAGRTHRSVRYPEGITGVGGPGVQCWDIHLGGRGVPDREAVFTLCHASSELVASTDPGRAIWP